LGDCVLEKYLKISEVARILGVFFPRSIIFGKNGLGYILVEFFTNSSGRPFTDVTFEALPYVVFIYQFLVKLKWCYLLHDITITITITNCNSSTPYVHLPAFVVSGLFYCRTFNELGNIVHY
jgi:hypothetical protein